MVIYLSVWLYNKRDQLKDVSFGLFPLAAILGIVGGLIALEPDWSAVMTIGLLGILMFFLVPSCASSSPCLFWGWVCHIVYLIILPPARALTFIGQG
jgi:cell division protein FtsW (lipid II flippase)